MCRIYAPEHTVYLSCLRVSVATFSISHEACMAAERVIRCANDAIQRHTELSQRQEVIHAGPDPDDTRKELS